MNKRKTATYGIVTFKRQSDKATEFVRVGEVKDRVEAVAKAGTMVKYLTMKDIVSVELKRVRLVME